MKSLEHEIFYDMKNNLYKIFILTRVPMANISREHYMEGVIR